MIYRNGMLALASVLVAVLLVAPQAWAGEVNIRGVVEDVQNTAGGTHATVKTDKETYEVRLGPSSFLSQNNFRIATGDKLSVSGYQTNAEGTTVLVAQEVRKGDRTLTLRDAQGSPAWAGQRMGRRNRGCAGWGCRRGRGGPGGGCRCGCR